MKLLLAHLATLALTATAASLLGAGAARELKTEDADSDYFDISLQQVMCVEYVVQPLLPVTLRALGLFIEEPAEDSPCEAGPTNTTSTCTTLQVNDQLAIPCRVCVFDRALFADAVVPSLLLGEGPSGLALPADARMISDCSPNVKKIAAAPEVYAELADDLLGRTANTTATTPNDNGRKLAWSGYVNNYDGALSYTCPSGQVVRGVYSVHRNGLEDRVWQYNCGYVYNNARYSNVYARSSYSNSYRGGENWMVPNGYAMVGGRSTHSNYYEDRRWIYYYSPQKYGSSYCSWTGYINNYDGVMSYTLPYNYWIAGMQSVYSTYYLDRTWSLYICRT